MAPELRMRLTDNDMRFVFNRFRGIYWSFVLLLVVIGFDEALSARGGRGGGGFRSSGSRFSVRNRYTSHNTRVRVRYNSYRPGRSWYSYGSSGHIYGFVYYTQSRRYYSNRDREPTICRNEYDNFMENGSNYEWFICPNMTNPDNYDTCCGDEDRQYCCKGGLDGTRVFGIIVGVFIFFLCIALLIYCCCYRKRSGREATLQQHLMTKHQSSQAKPVTVLYRPNANGTSSNAAEMTHLVNPPVNGPNPTYPQSDLPTYPPMPPSSQPMYPPQPGPGYQNGNYPQDNSGGYPLSPPSAEVYTGHPGSTQPPYPVQPPLAGAGLGYPDSSSVSSPPYPSDGSSAPSYPPYPTSEASAPLYPTDGCSAPPYPPYPVEGSSAPPYPHYPTDVSSAPCHPPYPSDGNSVPPYPYAAESTVPPYPPDNSQNYPTSPPPTYSSLK